MSLLAHMAESFAFTSMALTVLVWHVTHRSTGRHHE